MTSSTTKIQAVTDGTTPAKTTAGKPEHGLTVLRRNEGQALAQIARDALWETSIVTDEINKGIRTGEIPHPELQRMLLDALGCMETADHYLRMLDEVLDPGDSPAWESKPDR